jgi:hypothetical protein
VLINFTHSTAGPQQLTARIIELLWVRGGVNNQCMQISLDGSLTPINAGESITGITITELDPSAAGTTVALDVLSSELLLRRVRSPGPTPSQIRFLSYNVEDLTASGQNPYQRVFYVPAQTTLNCFLLFHNDDTLFSNDVNAASYRWAINGQYETNEPINFGSSEQVQQLRRAFANAGMPLTDLTRSSPDIGASTGVLRYSRDPALAIKVVAQPVQVGDPVQTQHALQLELSYFAAGAGRLLLFRQEMAAINL